MSRLHSAPTVRLCQAKSQRPIYTGIFGLNDLPTGHRPRSTFAKTERLASARHLPSKCRRLPATRSLAAAAEASAAGGFLPHTCRPVALCSLACGVLLTLLLQRVAQWLLTTRWARTYAAQLSRVYNAVFGSRTDAYSETATGSRSSNNDSSGVSRWACKRGCLCAVRNAPITQSVVLQDAGAG